MSAVIRWETPPPARSKGYPIGVGKSRWEPVAEELRAQPGKWALIVECPFTEHTGLATQIRMGQVLCFSPAGDFDAVSRQVNGTRRVWAMFAGDGE